MERISQETERIAADIGINKWELLDDPDYVDEYYGTENEMTPTDHRQHLIDYLNE